MTEARLHENLEAVIEKITSRDEEEEPVCHRGRNEILTKTTDLSDLS